MTVAPERIAGDRVMVPALEQLGVTAFTTTRAAGSFGLHSGEPVATVTARWDGLCHRLHERAPRLATSRQVHGTHILEHGAEWSGWLRAAGADGHLTAERGTALAVTVADCVPIFVAHPAGVVGVLHAGWRGVAGHILAAGVRSLAWRGRHATDLVIHLGPAICGQCYEVGGDVYQRVTGRPASGSARVDLRDELERQAQALGIRAVTRSALCTRCDSATLFSHRAGDEGRQLAVILRPLEVDSR